MTRFLFGERLWKEITARTRTAFRTRAAIAYVTKPALLPLKSGDVLVVDATEGAIATAQTSAILLSELYAMGVSLYSHQGLHAKVVIADSFLFSSSANLSESSVSRLLEAGIETDNPNSVSAANGMIETLKETSEAIDSAVLERIRRIRVEKRFKRGISEARAADRRFRDSVTWLLGIQTIDYPTGDEELKRIGNSIKKAEALRSEPDSSVSWIRYRLKDKMREALRGDSIVMIDTDSSGNPTQVYPHATILRVDEEPNCIRVYYEDPRNFSALPWSQFKKMAIKGFPARFATGTTRQLSDTTSNDLRDSWSKVLAR